MFQRSKISIVSKFVPVQAKIMEEKELEILFDRWRDWSSDGSQTGFKTRTIEYQLMIEGAVTRSTGSNVKEDPECEKLDAAVSAMPQQMNKAVKLKFLFGFNNKDGAKALKMAVPTYKNLIQRCRSWLCGRLTD
jgi:DNA-directed RNA polymerase specialized sigma24 family protein